MKIIAVGSANEIDRVVRLGSRIWNEYYVPLIGQSQVDYMLNKFQSAPALEEQMRRGYEYFLVQTPPGEGDCGYFGVQAEPASQSLFLSKFYLDKAARGRGLGRLLMSYIEGLARERGLKRLWLTVNKGNPAVKVYLRLGFAIAEAVVMDIGAGYVMDDYRMEKVL